MFVTYDVSVTDTPIVVTYDICSLHIIQLTCVRCTGTTITETLITDDVCSLHMVQITYVCYR